MYLSHTPPIADRRSLTLRPPWEEIWLDAPTSSRPSGRTILWSCPLTDRPSSWTPPGAWDTFPKLVTGQTQRTNLAWMETQTTGNLFVRGQKIPRAESSGYFTLVEICTLLVLLFLFWLIHTSLCEQFLLHKADTDPRDLTSQKVHIQGLTLNYQLSVSSLLDCGGAFVEINTSMLGLTHLPCCVQVQPRSWLHTHSNWWGCGGQQLSYWMSPHPFPVLLSQMIPLTDPAASGLNQCCSKDGVHPQSHTPQAPVHTLQWNQLRSPLPLILP